MGGWVGGCGGGVEVGVEGGPRCHMACVDKRPPPPPPHTHCCVFAQVLDSPFSRLTDLMLELASDQQLRIPRPLAKVGQACWGGVGVGAGEVGGGGRRRVCLPRTHTRLCIPSPTPTPPLIPPQVAMGLMRRSVRRRAGFSIDSLAPLDSAPASFTPALFGGWVGGWGGGGWVGGVGTGVAACLCARWVVWQLPTHTPPHPLPLPPPACLPGHARDDTFVACHHSERLFAAYSGRCVCVWEGGEGVPGGAVALSSIPPPPHGHPPPPPPLFHPPPATPPLSPASL